MGQPSAGGLILGKIGYLNILPIYHPLETGIVPHPFRIVSGAPAYLNELMARGQLDLSVVSSIEYARHPERYFILPGLSISCHGPVKSVLLLSRTPAEELSGETILASAQSHTSVGLLNVLFSRHLGVEQVRFKSGNCSEALATGEPPKAMLVIGDEALRLRNHAAYPHVMDLGESWHEFTGRPFVFALWVIQRKAIERWNGGLDMAVRSLATAKDWGASHLDTVCSEAMRAGILGMAELHEYYRCLKYDLSDYERAGLELFYEYLVQTGEIARAPRLELLSPLESVA